MRMNYVHILRYMENAVIYVLIILMRKMKSHRDIRPGKAVRPAVML